MPKVILSTNNNLEYYFYLPITSFVWNHFGFEAVNIVVGKSPMEKLILKYTKKYTKSRIFKIKEIEGYRSETIAQFSRLYAGCIVKDDYLMIGDIDMIPLSNYLYNYYLYKDVEHMNLFGHDLTDYTQYPMCYIAMYAQRWREFLNLDYKKFYENIKRDLAEIPKAKGTQFEEYWDVDQYFLTNKVKEYGEEKFNKINRGKLQNGYAVGRVDRSVWNWMVSEQYVDCHMLRNPYSDENFQKTYNLITHTLKDVDCSWMIKYHEDFKNRINNLK